MWFYEEGEVEPIETQKESAGSPSSGLWLVSGPSDPAPMPMGTQVRANSASVSQAAKRRKRGEGGENSLCPVTLNVSNKFAQAGENLTGKAISIDGRVDIGEENVAFPALRDIGGTSGNGTTATTSSDDGRSTSTNDSITKVPVRLALVGATGLVGRACATYLAEHPELGYMVSHFIGSALSKDRSLSEVAGEKEAKLRAHYGETFWDSTTDVSVDALREATVCDVDALMSAGPECCDVVLSFLAPRFGHLEDNMIAAGFRLVSISPHHRMAHPLIVPVVNGNTNGNPLDFSSARCLKSPNCCSVGSSVALLPLVDTFTVQEVFITTFQTLSGRGDALYPAEKVVANVYPIGATEERTEEYIAQEVARVYEKHPRATALSKEAMHVSAYRVFVQKNHLLDVRVRVAEALVSTSGSPETSKAMLASIYSQVKYAEDIVVMTEAGQPRPRSHNEPHKVTVGNFDVEAAPGGGSMIRVSAIVDNVAKGAWGNALEITKRVVKACATNTKW